MRIALAGNPNSGKTTMYNGLTGKNEKVGNWAGVTVDKKEHPIKKSLYSGEAELIAVDLPGAYSMSPFTSEESVTRDFILKDAPDVIINIVDATNLSRSLFFTTQPILFHSALRLLVTTTSAPVSRTFFITTSPRATGALSSTLSSSFITSGTISRGISAELLTGQRRHIAPSILTVDVKVRIGAVNSLIP